MQNNIYLLPKTTIKRAIMKAARCDKLKEACEIISRATGIPPYIIYSTSQGSYSPKYFLYLMAYLGQYVDIDQLLRTSEIQSNINHHKDRI